MALNLPDAPVVGDTGVTTDIAQIIAALYELDERKAETLAIGNVDTGLPGSSVEATIIPGPNGTYTLNLSIPRGDTGGAGSPGLQGDPGDKGDTGIGVPAGGTTGQALVKSTPDDYETEWGELDIAHVTGLAAALADKEDKGHATKHEQGGIDPISIAQSQVVGLVQVLRSLTRVIVLDVGESVPEGTPRGTIVFLRGT